MQFFSLNDIRHDLLDLRRFAEATEVVNVTIVKPLSVSEKKRSIKGRRIAMGDDMMDLQFAD